VERVIYYHLRDGSQLTATRDESHFGWLLDTVLPHAVQMLERDKFPPHFGYWCNWCDFRHLCAAHNATEQGENSSVESRPVEDAVGPDAVVPDEVATAGQQAALRALLSHTGWSEVQVSDYLTTHFSEPSRQHTSNPCISKDCISIAQLTQQQASQWLLELQRTERTKAQQRRQSAVPLNGKPASS
jgi:hypothetical protein